jgi:hypothetical protein
MRITPYEGSESLEEIEGLSIVIKAVPFEGSYAPAFALICPDEEYLITIEEAACLMDGIEIANERVDELIAFILQGKVHERLSNKEYYFEDEEDDEDDEDDLG